MNDQTDELVHNEDKRYPSKSLCSASMKALSRWEARFRRQAMQ